MTVAGWEREFHKMRAAWERLAQSEEVTMVQSRARTWDEVIARAVEATADADSGPVKDAVGRAVEELRSDEMVELVSLVREREALARALPGPGQEAVRLAFHTVAFAVHVCTAAKRAEELDAR